MCRVLVVEDDGETREAIAELIESEGHRQGQVCNGQEALDWLAEQSEMPCIILLDLRMPVMDGWDFLNALRRVPKWNSIAVVVLSGAVEPAAPNPVLPAKGFLSKPLAYQDVSKLHRYCEQHCDSWISAPSHRVAPGGRGAS